LHSVLALPLVALGVAGLLSAQTDPGGRSGTPDAGGQIAGLTAREEKFFNTGLDSFNQIASVSGTVLGTEPGLGPRYNLDSCAGCHKFPAAGGSSPASNPQVTAAPSFQVNSLLLLDMISASGPVREVRFKSDGGVHDLFTIQGRADTPAGCNISQPDFAAHYPHDISFRIPTPTFGAGLIEAIPDSAIAALESLVKPYGIKGRANRNGNDGTITRFGWKAQNKSLLIFAGEAYNVEQGVTNELFPDERGEGGVQDPLPCRVVPSAQDHTNYRASPPVNVPSDVVAFANFMRFLAPPEPVSSYGSVSAASIFNGRSQFGRIGCATCHTPFMQTGNHDTAALANKTAHLYSDLLVHNMGLLGDGISQGNAGPNEFRTSPLWGLGQRIYFLHDGRTSDLLAAIEAHAAAGTDPGSEAQQVIQNFNALPAGDRQDILNFLRSL
jgi:CxxC motif-containing protein (DUF1111 family)